MSTRLGWLGSGLGLLLCTVSLGFVSAGAAQGVHRYTITMNEDLSEFWVKACFVGQPPRTLTTGSSRAAIFLRSVGIGDRSKLARLNTRDVISLQGVHPGGCIEYSVDVRAATGAMRVPRVRHRGGDVLMYASSWLWLPNNPQPETEIELVFVLPEGQSVSAPWRLIERNSNRAVYRLGKTPYTWPALVAIGHFSVEALEVPGAVIRLAVLNGSPSVESDMIRTWIRHGASSLAALYGRFPIPSPQVVVVPIGSWSEPVPWGQVLRGGGPAVHLFIDQTRPLEEFVKDWTLVHELSHMILPYIQHSEPWLYEGIATYYQNVLQARAGTLTELRTWQKLHEGFQRGGRGTRKSNTLAEVSESMIRNRAFMRVYWSGTAIALLADLELRRRGQSLDQVLSELQECCLPSVQRWSAREIMRKLDDLTDTQIFMTLYNQHVRSDSFPDLSAAYVQLGLKVNAETIQFDDTAPLAHLRKAITAKVPPAND